MQPITFPGRFLKNKFHTSERGVFTQKRSFVNVTIWDNAIFKLIPTSERYPFCFCQATRQMPGIFLNDFLFRKACISTDNLDFK